MQSDYSREAESGVSALNKTATFAVPYYAVMAWVGELTQVRHGDTVQWWIVAKPASLSISYLALGVSFAKVK